MATTDPERSLRSRLTVHPGAVLTILAGILLILSRDRLMSEAYQNGTRVGRLYFGDQFLATGGTVFILLGAASLALGRRAGWKTIAACIGVAAATLLSFLLIGLKADDTFGKTDNHFAIGAWLIFVAFALTVLSVVAYLALNRQANGDGRSGAALGLSLISLVFVPVAPAGIALAGKRRAPRIIGALALVLWLGGLTIGIFATHT